MFGVVRRVLWRTVRLELALGVDTTGAAESCCNPATMGAWAESVQVSDAVASGVLNGVSSSVNGKLRHD